MKLVFAHAGDVHDVRGKMRFGANGLRFVGPAAGIPEMRVACVVAQGDGSFFVYGYRQVNDAPWRIMRCRTFDGLHYEDGEVVFESGAEEGRRWLRFSDMACNLRDGSLLFLKCATARGAHEIWAFGSKNGVNWERLSEKPVYLDHDSFGLMWDERTGLYVNYQATYQTCRKPYEDNAGADIRRVLHIRTSEDGINWNPGTNVVARRKHIPKSRLITPDRDDPPELEFYRFQVFPHCGRYIGMMLNYAPLPHAVNPSYPWSKHGPHLSGEWWVSADGREWERPFRDVFAPGEAPGIIEHNPINVRGRHLWIMGDGVYGLPQDRIFFVGSLANAEFSTVPFAMPETPLVLNASLCYHGMAGRGMQGQSYIMVEILREDGSPVKKFARERCIIRHMDGQTQRLKWGEEDGTSLAGKTVRLRFHLRDARIYAVGTEWRQ